MISHWLKGCGAVTGAQWLERNHHLVALTYVEKWLEFTLKPHFLLFSKGLRLLPQMFFRQDWLVSTVGVCCWRNFKWNKIGLGINCKKANALMFPFPGKTGLKDRGNQATGSLKKEVWKNVSSPQRVLPIAIFGSERGLFCFLVFLISQGPVEVRLCPRNFPGLPHTASPLIDLCFSPTSWAWLYLKIVLICHFPIMTITFDTALLCAKHCAECFAIIIPSNPSHKASTVTYIS